MADQENQSQNQKPVTVFYGSAELYIATQERAVSAYTIKNLEAEYNLGSYGIHLSEPSCLESLIKKAEAEEIEVIADIRQISIDGRKGKLIALGLTLKQEEP